MFKYLLILALLAHPELAAAQGRPAKELFGTAPLPADLPPEPVGFYSRGCMAGGAQLAPDGPLWQAMRLSRNRQWGTPILIDFIQDLARAAAAEDGWPGLLVGDMSQPRGGPMLTGHASHQTGLDADIWLTPMPDRRLSAREREDVSATPVVEPGPHEVFPNIWTEAHGKVIRRAALDPRVERIFVAPGIKKKLCEMGDSDRGWMRKVRPYYGHNYHFHVRLSCPPGTSCRAQSPPPPGDGCGADLAYWFGPEPYRQAPPPPKPAKPPKEVMLSDLPPACREVISAEARPGAVTMVEAFAAGQGEAPSSVAALPLAAPASAPPAAAAAASAAELTPAPAAPAAMPDAEEDPDLARLPRPRPARD